MGYTRREERVGAIFTSDTRPMSTSLSTSTSTSAQSLTSHYTVLVKARLSLLVVMTSGVGYVMAAPGGLDWLVLLWTVVGTFLCACSANGLNQVIEHRRDALMDRTKERPVPTGSISPQHGWVFCMITGYAGLSMLSLLVNLPAAGLALATMLIYVLLYTPMKVHTTLNTLVGAVVGGIPPLIGWVAASGTITTGALILAAILFVWQLPHFLALAWMYRDDYNRAGFKMLPGVPGGEHLTCEVVLLTTLLLIPLGLSATMVGIAGVVYGICSLLLGIGFLLPAVQFFRVRDRTSARRVFFASLLYLPLMMCVMIADRGEEVPSRSTVLVLQEMDAVPTSAPRPDDF